AGRREAARAALGIAPDRVVVLFVGRLSFHGKAHPLPMYLGLERVARERPVTLVQAGWFANEPIERAFRDDAHKLCPSVDYRTVDGRDQSRLKLAWDAADIFTSLSDNVQETFGLTPLEAMAAGLPVVVSDWDGYRDTVRDGIDGFRVPTLAPAPGHGGDLADRFDLHVDNYDLYCGHAGQFTAVDVEAAGRAYAMLAGDPDLRARMGAAGAQRARECFDWSHVFGRYRDLWADLGERRRSAPNL
ncbi:glycosyltransferase family 4 protein, partial [Methylobacterium trifolii]